MTIGQVTGTINMDTTYTEMQTIPDYVAPIWHDGKVLNRDELKWSGKEAPPAIGDRVYVTVNNCGPAKVLGYFTVDGYLGLLVKLEEPPEWFLKQNGGNIDGHVFGAEYRRL